MQNKLIKKVNIQLMKSVLSGECSRNEELRALFLVIEIQYV